eukprot:6758240-Pyramimonas_sp.AAC.1
MVEGRSVEGRSVGPESNAALSDLDGARHSFITPGRPQQKRLEATGKGKARRSAPLCSREKYEDMKEARTRANDHTNAL